MTFRGKNFTLPTAYLTDERLAEIEARAAAATERLYVVAESVYAIGRGPVVASFFDDAARENAVFMVAARADVPDLIAALRSERARAEAAEADNKTLTEEHDFLTRMAFYEAPGHPSHRLPWKDRAEAAEARLAEAVAVLREIDHERQFIGSPLEDRNDWDRALDAIAPVLKAYDDAQTEEPTP